MEHLYGLLPSENSSPREDLGDCGSSFITGAFSKGGIVGLRFNTRAYPASTALLFQYLRQELPDFACSTIALFKNTLTAVHTDSRNGRHPNAALPISSFSQGQIWIESPSGTHPMTIDDSVVPGELLPVNEKPVVFDAWRLRHCTMPWKGTRLILVGFSVARSHSLSAHDKQILSAVGVCLPPSAHSTCTAPKAQPVSCQEMDHLAQVKQRLAGRPLANLFFIQIFAREGALCAAVRKSGLSGKGIDFKVQGSVRCPVVPLDLSTPQGLQLTLNILQQQPVAAVHITPPLHSWHHMLPSALPVVDATVTIINSCRDLGILWSVSGPSATKLWPPVLLEALSSTCATRTQLDLCMFGAGWKLPTVIFHSFSALCTLGVSCSGNHAHNMSSQPKLGLPPLFCAAFVECLLKQLFDLGVQPPAKSLPE